MTRGGFLSRQVIRVLAWATTSATCRVAHAHLSESWVALARAYGWWVRVAGPRNFLLWRNHLTPEMALRVMVLPNRDCGLSSAEFGAVIADLAQRAGLPEVSDQAISAGQRYWLDRADRRLMEKIAPISARLS